MIKMPADIFSAGILFMGRYESGFIQQREPSAADRPISSETIDCFICKTAGHRVLLQINFEITGSFEISRRRMGWKGIKKTMNVAACNTQINEFLIFFVEEKKRPVFSQVF